MEHVLVAGGAGFLGSHLCDLLLAKGCKVTAMDNLLTGSADNIAHNLSNPSFSFVQHDITDYIHIDDSVDGVFNLASPASPIEYAEHPIATLKAGSLGTHNTLGLALANKAVYFMASTSEIYGDPLVHPQREDYWGNVNTIGPRSCYDEAKRFSEALTMAYHKAHGLDTRIIRIFNTYGPRMRVDDGRVVPTLIYQALKGEPLTVFGDGSQTRSFCYVSDEVEGIYRLYRSGCNEPVNVGNPSEMTVLEFTHLVKRLTNSTSEIVYCPLPVDDPIKRKPDISKAKQLLEWEPKVEIEEGLMAAVADIKAKIG